MAGGNGVSYCSMSSGVECRYHELFSHVWKRWSNWDVRVSFELRMSKPPSAQPLKVPATPSKSAETDRDKTPVANKQSVPSKLGTIAPKDISSPHELTAFVSHKVSMHSWPLILALGGDSSRAIRFQVRRDVVTDFRKEYVKIGKKICWSFNPSFLSESDVN